MTAAPAGVSFLSSEIDVANPLPSMGNMAARPVSSGVDIALTSTESSSCTNEPVAQACSDLDSVNKVPPVVAS